LDLVVVPDKESLDDYHFDARILIIDVTNHQSYLDLPIWHNMFVSNHPNQPIVILGNKIDTQEVSVTMQDKENLLLATKGFYKYYDHSTKTNYNFEKAILEILRLLSRDKNLTLIDKV
jgi:GTPase SAR1 family protein